MQHILFLALTVLSHIGASCFFAKPRFHKLIIAVIWMLYGGSFLIIPQNASYTYFVLFLLHFGLFFVTTVGRPVEKGFLFFSYATTYACCSTLFNMLDHFLPYMALKILCAVLLMATMQYLLYRQLLPAFRKVANYIDKGWWKFYSVVISFWALIVAQSLHTLMRPMSGEEIMFFLLTTLAFIVSYIAIFSSMKNIVELSREKQKTLHTELLQAQVDAQEKEARLVYQNRHDMRFHYQALMTLAKTGDTDRIIDYLNHQSESLEATTTGRFCENETVNNILKVFHQKAATKGIAMEIRAAAKPDISVPSPALVTVIANILENALHGAAESRSKKPSITISVKHKAGRLVITCENTCGAMLSFTEMPEHLQGIGIHSVITTAEKYNGTCRFSAAGGVFSATVIMDE